MINDIIGINANNIPNCQNTIRDYIDGVNQVVDKIKADAGQVSFPDGIQGSEQKVALEKYIEDAVEKIHVIVEHLNKFSEALNQVQANYQRQNENVASNMGSTSESDFTAVTGVNGFKD